MVLGPALSRFIELSPQLPRKLFQYWKKKEPQKHLSPSVAVEVEKNLFDFSGFDKRRLFAPLETHYEKKCTSHQECAQLQSIWDIFKEIINTKNNVPMLNRKRLNDAKL